MQEAQNKGQVMLVWTLCARSYSRAEISAQRDNHCGAVISAIQGRQAPFQYSVRSERLDQDNNFTELAGIIIQVSRQR
jgi:hypothetical protein